MPAPRAHSTLERLTVFGLLPAFMAVVMTLLGPYRVRNRKSVPRSGGLLILANHRSDVDPILVQLACPRPIHFMAKSELFAMRGLGAILRAARAFPVRRGEPDRAALKHAAALLRMGEAVCVFPEGELTMTGEMQAVKPGVALIARMADVPVVCLALTNTDRVMPYGSLVARPALRWLTATWGEPRRFGKETSADEFVGWVEAELRRLGAR